MTAPTAVVVVDRHTGEIQEGGAVPRHTPVISRDQLDLLKRTVCKGATDDEFALFVSVCNRTGLDPFARQVFAVKRWDAREGREIMAIQTSVDGFRLIAERSGKYQGQVGPLWCGADGVWRDVWLGEEPPSAARVGVWKDGFKEPLWGTARWTSYRQTTKQGALTNLWAKMPDLMLAKCAESLAIRRAFPQETSGLYTWEEMGQAASEAPKASDEPAKPEAMVMPFGKSRGKVTLAEMPTADLEGALAWASEKGKFEEFQAAAREVLTRRLTPATPVSYDQVPPALEAPDPNPLTDLALDQRLARGDA